MKQPPNFIKIRKNIKCFNCRGRGHFAKDCPKPRTTPPAGGAGGKGAGKKEATYFVVGNDDAEQSMMMICLDEDDGAACLQIFLNVREGCCVPDTGAGVPAVEAVPAAGLRQPWDRVLQARTFDRADALFVAHCHASR